MQVKQDAYDWAEASMQYNAKDPGLYSSRLAQQSGVRGNCICMALTQTKSRKELAAHFHLHALTEHLQAGVAIYMQVVPQ